MSIWRTEQTFSKQKRIEDSLFPFINYPAFTDFQLTFAKGYSNIKNIKPLIQVKEKLYWT
jgi:hypothetical protein